jgi:hypothetical protein
MAPELRRRPALTAGSFALAAAPCRLPYERATPGLVLKQMLLLYDPRGMAMAPSGLLPLASAFGRPLPLLASEPIGMGAGTLLGRKGDGG